ncbi:hypothetical protein PRIPAC_88635 [Pristionchus pacificus]|nr:hypothetical protein PRIPAC_88635 [Pristionchus pacificus]
MTRPHLVRINLTDISRAPAIFYTIFAVEMLLNVIVVLTIPFLIIAVHRAGVIHPNFRWQVALSGMYFTFAVFAR